MYISLSYQHAYVWFDVIIWLVALVAGVALGAHTLVILKVLLLGAVHKSANVKLVPLVIMKFELVVFTS